MSTSYKFGIFCCVLVFCNILVASQEEDDSPFTIELNSFEVDRKYDTTFIDWNDLSIRRKSRNVFVISGTMIVNLNMADEQSFQMQLYPYNQEIRGLLLFNIEKKICTFIAEDKKIYPPIMEASNFPEPGTCPLPKGEYTIKDYEVNASFLPSETPPGDYLVLVRIKSGNNVVAAAEVYVKVEKN
ncbi:chemosensory protein A 7a [Haematobia irritans]|uniref:chemosensory protein A 7a n=1 Tax=Haematobia irritans TaxID=7368 RepID=UPI003F500501